MARVLCIEDEEDIRQTIAEELSDAGYEVFEASNGQLGLESILCQTPDLVLCDVNMPVMGGHDLLRELRAKHPELADMPFIFLSALADRGYVVEGKRLGADDYLTKPIDFELLLATVESRLNQVQRMTAHKEEQFVKIYRSFNEHQANEHPAESQCGPAPARNGAGSAAPTAGPAGRAGMRALAERSGGSVLAGHVQIVGLDDIREALGERWASHMEQVRELAEKTIKRRLSSEDVFESADGNRFLICFAGLDEEAAAFKAQSIGREIRQVVLGDDSLDPEIKRRCDVATEVHRIEVSADEIDGSGDFVDLMLSRVGDAERAARERESRTIARIVSSSQILLMPVMTSKGKPSPLAMTLFDAATQSDVAGLRNARPGSEELASEIDILKLGKTCELLWETAHQSQPLALVDVCFTTLESRRLLERYLKICGKLSEAVINRLVFNVYGVPKDTVTSRTLSLLNALRQYGRQVALELSHPALGNLDPRTLRTPILSCRYHAVAARNGAGGDTLSRLLADLHERKARLLVHDVPNGEDARRLSGLGVDFVARRG